MFKRLWVGLSRTRSPLLCLLIVGVLAFAFLLAPYYLRFSLESFQPLNLQVGAPKSLVDFSQVGPGGVSDGAQSLKPGMSNPLASRVLLIVVNNLGQNDLENMPALQNLKDVSTGSYLFTEPVAANTPGLVTLLTGASSDLAGGLNFNPPGNGPTAPSLSDQLSHLDNLFTAAHRDGETTAMFGSQDWAQAMQAGWLDYQESFATNQPSTNVADHVINFLQKKGANLTVVQLSAVAQAQASFGNNSPQVIQARLDLNTALARLTSNNQVDLARTSVLVTGDWDSSSKAGNRWSVPLLLVGQAIQPGERSWGEQTDVAATIAALLGMEYPRTNEGRVLTNALAMNPQDLAQKMLTLVEQREALDNAYRQHLGLGLPLAINDPAAVEASKNVSVAIEDYKLGSFNDFETLVDPVFRYTQQDMANARSEWFAQARDQRLILAIAMLVLPLLLVLVWRSKLTLVTLVAAGVGTGLPYLFFNWQGYQYTFNSVSLDTIQAEAIWRGGIALLIGLVLIGLWFDWAEKGRNNVKRGRVHLDQLVIKELRKQPFPFPRVLAACAMLLGWLLFLSAFVWFVWYYWQFGFLGPLAPLHPPVVPDAAPNFLQFFALYNTLSFLIWLPLAPLMLSALVALKHRVLGDSTKGKTEEEEQEPEYALRPGAEAGIIKI